MDISNPNSVWLVDICIESIIAIQPTTQSQSQTQTQTQTLPNLSLPEPTQLVDLGFWIAPFNYCWVGVTFSIWV